MLWDEWEEEYCKYREGYGMGNVSVVENQG